MDQTDIGTQGTKARIETLIATADMPLITDQRLTFGSKTCHDHCSAAAQVCCVKHRTRQTVHTSDLCKLLMQRDIRAEADKLRHLAETVFKNCLPDHSPAPGF